MIQLQKLNITKNMSQATREYIYLNFHYRSFIREITVARERKFGLFIYLNRTIFRRRAQMEVNQKSRITVSFSETELLPAFHP